MKVATFNIQNIFSRHKKLLHSERTGDVLQCTKDFDALMYREEKREEDYQRMRKLAEILGFRNERETKLDPFIDQERLIKKKEGNNILSYDARALFERKRIVHPEFEPIDLRIVEKKALAIKRVDADILVLQEVESRRALLDFNQYFLKENRNSGYRNILFMPTNDPYGRGMGLLLKEGYILSSMVSHVNERSGNGALLFDKDLQEYDILSPSGHRLKILNTHFRFFNNNNERTKLQIMEQVKMTKTIVGDNLEKGNKEIIVLGTFNATRESGLLSELLLFPPLKQISMHRTFKGKEEGGSRESDQGILDHMLIMRKNSDMIVSSGILGKKDVLNGHVVLWAKWNHRTQVKHLKKAM